jgi:hypothetical protein
VTIEHETGRTRRDVTALAHTKSAWPLGGLIHEYELAAA